MKIRVSGTISKVPETVIVGSQSREEDQETAEKTSKRTTGIEGLSLCDYLVSKR